MRAFMAFLLGVSVGLGIPQHTPAAHLVLGLIIAFATCALVVGAVRG